MRYSFLLGLAAVSMACGGAIDTSLLDGGSSDGGGNDGTLSSDAAGDCAQLLAAANQALEAAVQCCPVCNIMQCDQQVDGLCCEVSVTNPDSSAVKQYLAALDAVRAAKCLVDCPAIMCPAGPTNNCVPNGGQNAGGTCAQF